MVSQSSHSTGLVCAHPHWIKICEIFLAARFHVAMNAKWWIWRWNLENRTHRNPNATTGKKDQQKYGPRKIYLFAPHPHAAMETHFIEKRRFIEGRRYISAKTCTPRGLAKIARRAFQPFWRLLGEILKSIFMSMNIRFHILEVYRLLKRMFNSFMSQSRDVPLNEDYRKDLEPSRSQNTVTVGIG